MIIFMAAFLPSSPGSRQAREVATVRGSRIGAMNRRVTVAPVFQPAKVADTKVGVTVKSVG